MLLFESGSGGLRAESGRKIRIVKEVKGSIWISFVATPSVKEGLAAATVSSGRDVTPNGLDSSGGDWIRFCNRCFKRNLKNTLYSFTATLGIFCSQPKKKKTARSLALRFFLEKVPVRVGFLVNYGKFIAELGLEDV